MTSTLKDEIRKERERASILAQETRQKVTGALENEIRKVRAEANILAEETRVFWESMNKRCKAAGEPLRKANEGSNNRSTAKAQTRQ